MCQNNCLKLRAFFIACALIWCLLHKYCADADNMFLRRMLPDVVSYSDVRQYTKELPPMNSRRIELKGTALSDRS